MRALKRSVAARCARAPDTDRGECRARRPTSIARRASWSPTASRARAFRSVLYGALSRRRRTTIRNVLAGAARDDRGRRGGFLNGGKLRGPCVFESALLDGMVKDARAPEPTRPDLISCADTAAGAMSCLTTKFSSDFRSRNVAHTDRSSRLSDRGRTRIHRSAHRRGESEFRRLSALAAAASVAEATGGLVFRSRRCGRLRREADRSLCDCTHCSNRRCRRGVVGPPL